MVSKADCSIHTPGFTSTRTQTVITVSPADAPHRSADIPPLSAARRSDLTRRPPGTANFVRILAFRDPPQISQKNSRNSGLTQVGLHAGAAGAFPVDLGIFYRGSSAGPRGTGCPPLLYSSLSSRAIEVSGRYTRAMVHVRRLRAAAATKYRVAFFRVLW